MNALTWSVCLAAGLALTACDSRKNDTTVGQKVDKAVATAQTAANEAKQNAARGLEQAAQTSKDKSQEVAQTVNDAAITAAVKAGIMKDPELSALRVNVDTKNGQVSLYGAAPNEAAKQRAQTIAMNEKGVTGVDNKLAIENK